MKCYSMKDAVQELGIPYHAVYYAIATHKINPMATAGRSRILSQIDLENLRQYFASRKAVK